MMSLTYMPFLRGRQNELRLLERAAPLIQRAPMVPIVEPVAANTAMLERVIEYYATFGFPLGVIVNPAVGDFRESSEHLLIRASQQLCRASQVFPVARASIGGVGWRRLERAEKIALIDDGPASNSIETNLLNNPDRILYQIKDSDAVRSPNLQLPCEQFVLRDGFERRRNVDYPEDEIFDSGPGHLALEGSSGWSDYLIVGRAHQVGGGPPHAVAIHITYWTTDGKMRVHHYLSTSNEGPEDTAGKFAEALEKLVSDQSKGTYPISETSALRQFRALHEREHFPGLGVVKLLSMLHHVETVGAQLQFARTVKNPGAVANTF